MPDLWKYYRAPDAADAAIMALTPRVYWDARVIKGYADGATIPTVIDRSGNQVHAISSGVSTRRATYKTAIKNSLPVIRFNGTGNWYNHWLNYSGASTTFAVFNRTGAVSAVQQLMCFSNAGTAVKAQILAKTDVTTNWGGYWSAFRTSSVSSLNTWNIACITDDDAGTVNMYNNGVASPVATYTSQTYYTDGSNDRRVIGGRGTEYFGGDFAAGLLFPSVLSAGNLATVFSSLNSIWGVY